MVRKTRKRRTKARELHKSNQLLSERLMQRAVNYFRQKGWMASIGEHTCYPGTRKTDLFGFGDLLAFYPPSPGDPAITAIIQVTSVGCMDARMTKISESESAQRWSECHEIYVFGWQTPFSLKKLGLDFKFPHRVVKHGVVFELLNWPDPVIYRVV